MPKKILIELSDFEVRVLENDLMDVDAWVHEAVAGKISNCKGRLANVERQKLTNEGVKSVPSSVDELCELAMGRKGYKNRKKREDERGIDNLKINR